MIAHAAASKQEIVSHNARQQCQSKEQSGKEVCKIGWRPVSAHRFYQIGNVGTGQIKMAELPENIVMPVGEGTVTQAIERSKEDPACSR